MQRKKQAAIKEILDFAEELNDTGNFYRIIPGMDRCIQKFLATYEYGSIRDLVGIRKYRGKATLQYGINEGTDVFGDILIVAIVMGKSNLVKALIDLGMLDDSKTKSDNSRANNLKPIHVACMNNRADMIKMLLEKNNDYLYISDGGVNIFNNLMSQDIYKVILDHLKQQIKARHVMTDPGAYNLLASLRVQYLTVDDKTGQTRQVIDDICDCLKKMICDSSKMKAVKFDANNTSSSNRNHKVSHQALFDKDLDQDTGEDKEAVLRRANSKILMLFSNPERCIPYLRFLNYEYARYCQQYPEDKFTASSVRSDMITWQEIYSLTVPVGNADYATPKKHSRLQEFLLSLFKKYEMGDEVIKWVGFVPTDIANQQVGGGNLVIESVYGSSSLFHGALSHMIQTAMMIYAYERGDIELPGISIKELIHSQVNTPSSDKEASSIWVDLRDKVNYHQATFYDPFRVNELIMLDKNGDMPDISAFVRDSFIGQTRRFADKVIESKPDFKDAATLLSKMADLEPRLFYRNDLLIEEAAIKLQNSGHKVLHDASGAYTYATAIRATYPVREDFHHKRFGSDESSDYEVIVKRDNVPPGHALYIGGADDKLGNWSRAYRMYYDDDKKHWAFNLPRGVSSKEFKFIIGPMHHKDAAKNTCGIYLSVTKDVWKFDKLDIENDVVKELFYHQSNDDSESIIKIIKKMAETINKEDLKSILSTPDLQTGNTLLHLIMSRRAVYFPLLTLLLEHGSDVTLKNKRGESVFTITMDFLNYSNYEWYTYNGLVQSVLKAHSSISEQEADALARNRLTINGRLALAFHAIEMNSMILLRAAIKNGVEPNNVNIYNNGLLRRAVFTEKLEATKYLLENHRSAQDELNSVPDIFKAACLSGNLEMVQLLLQQKVDINAGGLPILCFLINRASSHIHITEYLLQNTNIDINQSTEEKETPILLAVKNGNMGLITRLLDKGVDINIPDARGNTPLTWASNNGNMEILALLLERKSLLNPLTVEGAAPVFYAAKNGHIDAVKKLFASGAKVDFVLNNGESLLSAAYSQNNNTMLDLLLEHNVPYTVKDLKNDYLRGVACQKLDRKLASQGSIDNKIPQLKSNEIGLLQYVLRMSLDGAELTLIEQRLCVAVKQILKLNSTENADELHKTLELQFKMAEMRAMKSGQTIDLQSTSTGYYYCTEEFSSFLKNLPLLGSDELRLNSINENIHIIRNGFNMAMVLKCIQNEEFRIPIALLYLTPICRIINGNELANILETLPRKSRLGIAVNMTFLDLNRGNLSDVIRRLDTKDKLAYACMVISEGKIILRDYFIDSISQELDQNEGEAFKHYILRQQNRGEQAPSATAPGFSIFGGDNNLNEVKSPKNSTKEEYTYPKSTGSKRDG